MKKRFLALLAVGLFIISGCYYDKEDLLYGNGNTTCDTSAVMYSTTVKSILSNNACMSCHSGAGSSAGINFDTYAGVKATVTNGKLYGSITHASGYVAMPVGGNVSSCDIKKIKAWIDAGVPNN
jgi:cytochrome c5